MNFWHLFNVVKARMLMICAVVAVTILAVIIAAPKPMVVYQADVYMQPTPQVMSGGLTTAAGANTQTTVPDRGVILSNLIVLAKSGSVMSQAIDFLALDTAEQKKLSPGRREPEYRKIDRVEIDGKPIDYNAWLDLLDVAPVYNEAVGKDGTTTDVMRISVKMVDGDNAPFVANAIGYAFAEVYREKSREDTHKYSGFLLSSKNESKNRLHALQQQIAQFKSNRDVVAVDEETQTALTSLASLDAERNRAEADVWQAEAALRDINKQLASQPLIRMDTLPADMNPEYVKAKDQLVQAQSDLRDVAEKYRPAHPLYQAAQNKVTGLKQRVAELSRSYSTPTINDIHQSLAKQRSDTMYAVATARARLASLSSSAGKAKGKISNLAKAQPELAELMRDFAQEENTYKLISEKLEQTRIAEKETTSTGSIIPLSWAPIPATGPIVEGPTKKVLVVYGFVLSLILSIALAVWLDSIDNRMRNAADVEKLLGLPVLGLTPKLTGRAGLLPQQTHLYPFSPMAESYKILRTNILFEMRDNPFKTLMVATGRPGQGATTTVCNLAISLAQIGKKIILIDADMRRPSLHKFFNVSNEAGLSTLLQGTANVTDAFQTTDIPNLILVPAGPQPMNPSELIGSDRMREIVEKLEEHCDLVMFDTPSTIVFSDGPMLASWLDAVIMIVSANQAPRGTETVTRDLLRRAKANILGVVVNRMAPDAVDSCYYYSHYYADSVPTAGLPKLADHSSLGDSGNNGKNGKSADVKAIPSGTGEPTESEPKQTDNPFPE